MKWELDWIHNQEFHQKQLAVIDENTNRTWTFAEINRRAGAAAGWMKSLGGNGGPNCVISTKSYMLS